MTKNILLFANHNNGYAVTKYLANRSDARIVKLIVLKEPKDKWWKSVQDLAQKKKLDYIVFKENKSLYEQIKNLDIDLIISANWRHLIPAEVLNLAKIGSVNYHNSLLPKYRGAYANAWAIEKGENHAGVTLHWMSPQFDDGDIIAQKKVPIYPTDTAKELWERLNAAFLQLFQDYWPKVDSWKKISKKQVGIASFYSTKDYQQSNEIKLNEKIKAKELIDKLRARTFLPYYQNIYFVDPKTKKKITVSILLKEEKF